MKAKPQVLSNVAAALVWTIICGAVLWPFMERLTAEELLSFSVREPVVGAFLAFAVIVCSGMAVAKIVAALRAYRRSIVG